MKGAKLPGGFWLGDVNGWNSKHGLRLQVGWNICKLGQDDIAKLVGKGPSGDVSKLLPFA